jgi:uncharacterized membrane protein
MKRVAMISCTAIGIVFALALVFSSQTVNGSKKSITPGTGIALPDSIQKFVQRACMDCHADDGNFMAKGKINFSSWNQLDADKQAAKAGKMVKELTKSAMPPKKWRSNNPNGIPTQAEVDMVARWAKSLQK